MNRIQKLSRFLKRVFWVIFFGWPICLILIWFGDQQNGFLAQMGFSIKTFIPNNSLPILVPLSMATKIEGFVLSFIPMGLSMAIAYFCTRLFSCYEKGEVFTIKSIQYIKKIGILMIVWAILNPFYQLAMSLILTIHNPVGHRVLALGVGSGYVRNLIMAGLVFLIAYIMQEALKLHEDQSLTV